MAMFVSRTLDYTLRSLIALAQVSEQPQSLTSLAQQIHVSRSYLAKLMRTLVRRGLVQSITGAHGGYRLLHEPQDISVREIYEAVEGEFRTVLCQDGTDPCELRDDCTQLPVWMTLEAEIGAILDNHTLAEFLPETERFVPMSDVDDRRAVSI